MNRRSLPLIPHKRYFSIGETSQLCLVKPHVLRYWEQEFTQLKPTKRSGGRRYYQRKDVILVRCIKELLYDRGFTIAGAKKQLKTVHFSDDDEQVDLNLAGEVAPAKVEYSKEASNIISQVLEELESLLETLTA